MHQLLEAWYWSIMFSGEFDKDQNTVFINHLTNLLEMLPDYHNCKLVNWINELKQRVLDKDGFSDKRMLLMQDEEPNVPKKSIQNAILQYYLSQYYENFSMKEKDSLYTVFISAYTDEIYNATSDKKNKKYKLEIHHIIPLASMDDYQKEKRNNTKFYGNSPLNKLFIVAEDNGAISDDDISIYVKKISEEQRRNLNLFKGDTIEEMKRIEQALEFDVTAKRSKDSVMELFGLRFDALKKTVDAEISSLLKLPAPLNCV